MKKVLFITVLFFSFMSLNAQEMHFGAKLSGTSTTWVASGDNASYWNDHNQGKINFEVGLVGELMLTDQFAIAPEFNYATSGDVYKTNTYGVESTTTYSTSYVQIPLMAKYYINDNLSLSAGPQLGFLMAADWTSVSTYNSVSSTDSDNFKDDMNPTELALNLGVGYKMDNGLFFNIRYSKGMSELYKQESNTTYKSAAFKFGVGFFFN